MANNTKLFFSLVIPTLNEANYLPLLLHDISTQTFSNYEVIVVDAQSKDDTIKQAKKIGPQLKKLTIIETNKPNVSIQRNLGGKVARGEYILFNDADNRLPPYFLQGLKYRLTIDHPDLFTTWCAADSANSADKTIISLVNTALEVSFQINKPGALGAFIGVNRQAFQNSNGFNTNISFAEDSEFTRRMASQGHQVRLFRDPRYYYSFRRFRRQGTLKAIRNYAKLYTKTLLKAEINQPVEYPMGGHVDTSDNTTSSIIDHINNTLSKAIPKPKLHHRIKSWLTQIEE
jgi:glycosyltransferase involved in cell wall biosynthesis